jgi:hypothetical protein
MSPAKYESSASNFESEFDDFSRDESSEAKDHESRKQVARLAINETKNVRMWRRNVFLMLFATATLVTTLTFLFLRDEDAEDFSTSVSSILSNGKLHPCIKPKTVPYS